jgi:hypothetical protein
VKRATSNAAILIGGPIRAAHEGLSVMRLTVHLTGLGNCAVADDGLGSARGSDQTPEPGAAGRGTPLRRYSVFEVSRYVFERSIDIETYDRHAENCARS